MPKLTKEAAQERRAFVLNTWKKLWPRDPEAKGPTAAKVNDMVHAKFGEKMRSNILYELRDEAIAELRNAGHAVPEPSRKVRNGASAKPPRDPNAPRRGPGRPPKDPNAPRRGPGRPPKVRPPEAAAAPITHAGRSLGSPAVHSLPVIVRGLESSGVEAIKRTLDELRSAGAANLHVEFADEAASYVIIDVAP